MNTNNSVTLFEGWDLDTSDEEEPRARDTDIARRAGLAQPRDVRRIIEKNIEELTAYGSVTCRAQSARIEKNSGFVTGTEERTVNEYWLNAEQSVAPLSLLQTTDVESAESNGDVQVVDCLRGVSS